MNFKYLLLLAAGLLAASARAFGDDTFSSNGFKYQLLREDNAVMVVGCECPSVVSSDSVLHIPASVTCNDNTFKVISIGRRAFAGLAFVRSVVMDEGIMFVNEEAFLGCVNLQSVYIPASVEVVDDRLFAGCHSLTKIVVDPKNEDLDSRANSNAIIDSQENELLAGCSTTTIPSSVRSIGNWAFGYCSGIRVLVIPEGVETIGHCAFEGCSSLRYVSLPQSLRTIGCGVFSECGSLESLFIPKNVESIRGAYLLHGCKNLSSITVDEDNPVFDSRSDCNGIVMKSDSSLIAACPATTIVEGISKLSESCFSGLDIHNVSLPKSVTYVDQDAFSGCNEIETVSVDADNPVYTSPSGSNAILTKDGKTLVLGCRNTVLRTE